MGDPACFFGCIQKGRDCFKIGKPTSLFKTLQVGDGYQDVIGPLGKPTHLEKIVTVVCVGGGTGIAVLHPIARGLKEVGNH